LKKLLVGNRLFVLGVVIGGQLKEEKTEPVHYLLFTL
jgi:hypothetical protein